MKEKFDEKIFMEAHMKVQKLITELLNDGIPPMAIAGIVQATATQMYRNMLNEEEFIMLMASVVDASHEIKTDKTVLH